MNSMKNLLTKTGRYLLPIVAFMGFHFTCLSQNATSAFAGGDISYQMVGNDSLEITLNWYVDCGGNLSGTPFIILRNCSGTPMSAKDMGSPTITEVSNTTSTTNCGAGSVTGRRRYQYTTRIEIDSDLGTGCNFYRITLSRPSRNASANLSNSTSQNAWLQADIYLLNDDTNSSPVFTATPIPYVCNNSSVSFSPEVTDVDGDSLVFSLVAAQTGTASASNITYSSGSGGAPITGISIDASSGVISFTSPDSGNHQVVIAVDEYDRSSGNQISRVYRDFQFVVDSTCTNDGPQPSAAFSNTTNVVSSVGNDTVVIDTGVAASFRLTFTDANGISGYSSNAVGILGGNAAFNTANAQISWTPTGDDIGTHIVTISSEDNVTPISGKGAHTIVIVVQDEVLPFEVTSVSTGTQTCPDPANGTLTVNFTGGSGPYLFTVEGNFTGATDTNSNGLFTGLEFDVYRVYAIDSSTLDDTITGFFFTVLQNSLEVTSYTNLGDVSCDDACDGSLRVNHSGGVTPITYLWSSGETTKTAASLCGGSPIVTVTDNQGCVVTDTAALFEPPAVFAVVDSTDSASCNGAADGAAYLSGHGGTAASTVTNDYIIDQTEGSFEPYPYGEAENVTNYQTVSLGDDAVSSAINIGFSFDFYGVTYTQFQISSNGFITLGTGNTDNGCCSGETLPTSNALSPDKLIAGYWEDLDPNNGVDGVIETYEFGSGANEVRVINFIDVPHFPGAGSSEVTFQIALYESSNIIQIYGDSLPSDGGTHTQGIENATGDTAHFVTGRNGANWSATNDYVAFIPITQDFNYTWSSIGTTASATNLTAGTYTVTVADDDGCDDVLTFDIEEPAQIVIDTVVTPPGCPGDSTGSIAASATGGSGTFTFAWNTGATTATITNIPAGTYTVTATDDTGCEDSLTVVITDPTAVSVALTPVDASCLGDNDGQITAVGSGGTSGTFTFAWNTGSTANPLTGLTAGTYTVTATDGNGCTAVDSADVGEPATAVAVVADSTDESCPGANDGEATATGSGGTGTITFAWSNGGTTQTITGLAAGTYTVTATDANGCTAEDSTVVNAPASSVTVSIVDSTDVSCNGGNDGDAEAGNASGGTGPYTYLWNTGSTSQTITGLTAGTYTVTAQDNNGCEATDQVTIDEPATGVSVSITLDSNASCNGAADGGLTAAGVGGTGTITYAWSNGATTAVITGLTADTYTVTATDANGCTDTAQETITEPNAVSVSATSTDETCDGDDDGTATANGSGGTGTITYVWNTGGTTQTITGLAAGTYSVTATDANGCTDSTSVVVDGANPINLAMTSDSVSCPGANDGEATATATGGAGGFTYAWSNSGAGATITGLAAGVYTVTATDGNGCTAVDSVEVFEPATGVTASITVDSNVSCNGAADGGLTAAGAGGSGSYTFSWNTGATTATIDGLAAATYTVTVSDANGCTDIDSAAITEPNQLLAFATDVDQPTCNNSNDGSVAATQTGGTATYTYEWNTGATTSLVGSLTAGTYTVTVTDANGCTDDDDVTLSAPNPIVISTDSLAESCPGSADGEAYVTNVTGGSTPYTFLWNTGSTNDTITGLTAGLYTVTVTDNNSCTEEATISIGVGTGATVSADSTDITCNGDDDGTATATATGTGTLTFTWSNSGAAATINSLAPGTYTVTVTDANGCTAVDSTTVNEPAALVATASALLFETCTTNDGEATVNFTGAQGATTFGWSNSATTQTITGLNSGTYSVTVTDGNGCTDSSSVFIDDTCSCSIVPSAVVTTAPTCAGDSATVTASATGGSGTYTFLWPGGATTASTQLPAGTWCVTIDDGSCSDTACVIVTDPAGITFSAFTNVSQLSCDDECDGAGTANASGGSGTINYLWSSGSNTAAATGLCGGTYTITATDGNGCTETAMFALVEPPSIWVQLDSLDSASCGGSDGEAYLSAYGGFAVPTSTAAYVVDSTEGEFEPYGIGEPLNANSYEVVTLQDDALSDSIEIFAGGNFSFFGSTKTHFVICSQGFITFDLTNPNINGGQVNGMFSAQAAIPSSAGTTPEDFIAGFWTDLDPSVGAATIETYEIGQTPNRARIVNYVDVVHFAGGGNTDTNTFQIVLYENSNIIQIHSTQLRNDGGAAVQGIENAAENTAYGLTSRNNQIFDADDDYVAFIPTTQAFTYTWSSTGSGSSATNLAAGTYIVTAEDPNGCSDTISFDIDELPSTVDAGLSVDAGVSCTGTTNTGELSVSPSGGIGPYTQLWSTGSTATSINSLAAGTYTVTVTDNNGCQDTAQVTLSGTSSSIASPTILTNDTSVCVGTSLLLEGQTNSSSTFTDTSALLCTNTSGGIVTAVFSNVPNNAIGNATLSVTGFGDLDDGLFPENIAIIDENSGSVGTYDGSNTQCATSTETFSITQANINSWAANNVVSFVFDAGFFVTANSCSGNAYCVQAALTFPTAPDTSYWFEDPLNLDTALAIGFGDTVTVTPTTSTSYYYATYNGVCWSEPDTIDVDTLPSLNVSIVENTTINCPGDSASVTASATGGSGSLSFTWPTGETTATVSLPAGTWCVTVDDAGGTCSDTACVILVDPSGLTVSATGVDPLCNGGNNGTATATASGGAGGFTFAWSNGGTGATITGLSADTYTVTVTDANGCTATDTTVLTDPALLVASATSTDVDCFGDNNGTASASSTGGTGTVTFAWSNGGTGSALTGLTADTYIVTATDANGCTDTDTVSVIEPTLLVAIIDSTDSNDCFGAADGVAYASATGGTTTYTFAWSNGSTSDTASNLTAGTYIVTVTDANGCTDTASAVITEPATGMTVSITNTDSTSCNGGNDGEATALAANATGTVTYAWSNGDNGATTTSGLTAGTYTVTATDATGCTATTTATIEEPDALVFTTGAVTDVSCNGGNDGEIACGGITGGTPPYSYSWSSGSTVCPLTGLAAGDYTVTITDANGCTVSEGPITVDEPNPVDVTATATDIDCNGNANGTASASATGGTGTITFAWSNGGTGSTITGLTADTYTVTATDANGCTDTDTVVVIEPTALVANIDSTDSNDCFGAADGVAYASASGGTPNYTFAWSSGGTASTESNLTAGSYVVTVTDASGCTDTAVAVITEPATGMTVDVINIDSTSCFGGNDGEATALASNGQGTITYAWSNGDNGATTTSGLTAGTYTVTATDATGCTATDTALVESPDEIDLAMSGNDPSCAGEDDGDASVTVNSGGVGTITFAWSNGGTGATINGLTAGMYIVTATDGNGCTASDTIILTDPAGIGATFNNIVESSCTSCTGEATVSATGVATLIYAWPGAQTGTSATGLCDGINVLTITDGNGCVDSFNVLIPSDSADTIFNTVGVDPLCNGGCDGLAFTINSCTGCTFNWIDSATSTTVSTADTATGLCAGTYYVEMVNSGGCSTFDTITLADPAGITVPVPTSTNVSCLGGNDGTASATATGGAGGFTFTWSNGATGANIGGLTAGTYTVYATDLNGCSDSNSVVITQPATGLSVVATVDSNVTCNGDNNGGVSAVAAGGSGTVTYTWNGSLNGATQTGLTAGTYTVVVSDAGSCTATDTVVVTEPSAIIGLIDSVNNPTCPGDSNGSAGVSAVGGSGTLSFAWPSGNTAQVENNLPAGTYPVTITDTNGCEEILNVVVTDPAGMTNTFSGITNSSCTVCDGTATANVTGGNGTNYTFIWGNGQTTSTNDSLCAGVNGVTITDSLGCTLEDFVPINADGADTVFADSIDATCGSCDGVAYATYNCNNGPCTLEWTAFGSSTVLATTDTLDSLCGGIYFASLTNNLGCTSVDQVTVVSPDPIDPNDTIVNESCPGAADGSITLNPQGGSGTFSYTWSNGAGNVATITGLTAGNYTVTIADNAGCDTIATFTLTAPTSITLANAITNASCFGECDGTATITPSGGGGSYTYTWNPVPGNGQGVQAATGLCAGDYFLTVTDINGCTAEDTITITEPTEIVQTFVQVDSAECGVCDGEILQTVSGGAGGYTYLWNNADTAASIDSLCFGFYDVTVTDANGCTETFGHPVSETDGPEITLSAVNTSAAGQCDGTATVTVVNSQGTVAYNWSNGDTTATADSLCAGLVIVTVTDINGCSTVDTINIFEPDALLLTMASSAITCEGGPCDGDATVAVSGGVQPYTYAWSNASTNDTISGLCAGTYTVTVTDANGTFAVDSVTLDNPSPFTIVSNVTDLTCPGVCDGVISLNITGPGIPMIIWSTGDTTSMIDSLCAGTYTVTVSDTSGCDDSLTFVLTSPPDIDLTVTATVEPDCQTNNGSVTVMASGGTGSTYDYLWLDVTMTPLIPVQDSTTAINLGAGIYNVEVTDSNGCTDTFNIILNNNNAPDITLDSIVDVSCFGECDGSVSVTLSGGVNPYTILWSSGNTNEDDSNLCAGFDTLAVADANLCLAFGIYEVEEPAELLLETFDVTSVICGSSCDGEITVHVRGGSAPYSYSWSNGDTDSTITDLCAGLYDVTVTDANGCTVTGQANVVGPQAMVLTVDSTNDATCTYTGDGNVLITVTGGTPGYTYSWMADDSTTFSSQDLTNVVSGTYMLTITDATGCTISDTFEIDALNFVDVSVDDDFDVCPDSRGITIVGEDSLATSVRWLDSNGVVISSSRTAVVDALRDSNMYVFEGTNGLCVARDTIFLLETEGPGIEAGNNKNIEPGDEVVIGGDPTARDGVEVTWTPDADITSTTDFNPTVNPLKTTTYYVSGIDGDECFGIDSVVVTVEKIVDPVGGFSPNGDGVNELFIIDRIEKYPDAVVQIFNRWGNLIYTSDKGYTKPWNGKYNGNELSIGTYYYAIDLNVDGVDIITGPVTILK